MKKFNPESPLAACQASTFGKIFRHLFSHFKKCGIHFEQKEFGNKGGCKARIKDLSQEAALARLVILANLPTELARWWIMAAHSAMAPSLLSTLLAAIKALLA